MIVTKVFGGARHALESPLYRRYWIGHSVASIGRWMYRTAVGWLAWELTHSSAWLGIIAFADLLPTVVLTILAGAFADRFGFMRIIRASQISAALLTALLATLVIMNLVTIEILLVITMVMGAAESMGQPARMAIVNALVRKRDLSSAIALGSASFNASRIVGPGIAGGLILWAGSGFVIALCALAFFSFFMVLRKISIEEKPATHRSSAGLFKDIGGGVVYAWRHTGIRFVMTLLAATSFFIRPVIDLMPAVSAQLFSGGPTGLALLLAAIGVGAVIASLWLARRGETKGLTSLLVLSTSITGIALVLAMQFSSIWAGAACLSVMGFFMLIGNVSAQTLVQNSVDQEFRARVSSLFIIFAYGLPAIGAVISGWLATHVGLHVAIGTGASMMLLAWLWARPKRRAMSLKLDEAAPQSRHGR
ncbi:MAG: MFS transporter [Beijerinckiaceae bacterium]|nr:MFS transporter [Beijerinckiaceae bacterium]